MTAGPIASAEAAKGDELTSKRLEVSVCRVLPALPSRASKERVMLRLQASGATSIAIVGGKERGDCG